MHIKFDFKLKLYFKLKNDVIDFIVSTCNNASSIK